MSEPAREAAPPPSHIPTKVGDLLHLREPDYCFGTGTLVLRVTAAPVPTRDPEWISVQGIEIGWSGDRLGDREVTVRAKVLLDPRTYSAP